jgi:phosphate-selective porin
LIGSPRGATDLIGSPRTGLVASAASIRGSVRAKNRLETNVAATNVPANLKPDRTVDVLMCGSFITELTHFDNHYQNEP